MCTDKKYILLTVIFLLLNTVCFSQYRGRPFIFNEGLSIAVKGGINVFYGDLVDKSRNSYSFGATLDREMHDFFTLRTQFMSGAMKGTQIPEGHHFNNFYLEWTVGGTYNVLNHALGYFRERIFQPYAILHGGILYHNTTEYWGERYVENYRLENNIWRKTSGVVPILGLGGGTTIWINPRFRATAEFHGNFVFSDKVDGHDVWHLPLNNEMHETADNDFYYTATVGLLYILNDSRYGNSFGYSSKAYDRIRKYYNRKNKKSSQSYRR